ncbi:hypothetical protein FRX31_033287 [Thalictrum thalictroides]|uniref:Uncharacterized protein n=1 Tax=Thalictrum thalictroides TaxID=46969 RepID=A0A7J6UX02_THATH|nr:hypothetical protein FRX31_033287 [Thalictrum thalictroides]
MPKVVGQLNQPKVSEVGDMPKIVAPLDQANVAQQGDSRFITYSEVNDGDRSRMLLNSLKVQHSIIHMRPQQKMAELCQHKGVKLITYGTKYKRMVDAWGGWSLFQALLKTLNQIATKYGIQNLFICWLLTVALHLRSCWKPKIGYYQLVARALKSIWFYELKLEI